MSLFGSSDPIDAQSIPGPSPKERLERLNNLVKLRDAFAYWHFREWGRHDLSSLDMFIEFGNAATIFEDCAGNGVLEIWGRTGDNPSTFATPIPAEAWKEQLIDRSSAFTEIASTEYRSVEPSYQYKRFYDLAVNWKEVEEIFPPKSFGRTRIWMKKTRRALTGS